jgi:phosphatidylinositol alpha-1,6-mannosyltransferase
MYLIVTRSFPPELGGMQSLMWGLARELSKNFMIKVFADYVENIKNLMNKQHFLLKELVDLNYLESIESLSH